MAKISVVINTLNEEKNIKRAIESVKWADEVVIVDDGSTDGTLEVVSSIKYHVSSIKIFKHESQGYVEPARNFAISKATGDFVLILDADEEIPDTLAKKLQEIAEKMLEIDFVWIPRKNFIFGKWMKASMWWPDNNIRFFKKGAVSWSDKIHVPPKTEGEGLTLDAGESYAIIHHHYDNLTQYLDRLIRYTEIQAKEMVADGYKFKWQDLVTKPTSEFLGRFFANKGFEDGVHGLALSFLQAFSFLIMYLRVWEMEKFSEQTVTLNELKELRVKMGFEIDYWFKYGNLSKNPFKRFAQKVKNKL